MVDPEELAEPRPRTTRTVDVSDFVDLADVDPIYYRSTYWLAPDGEAATRAYRLLLAAMEEQHRAGIGMVVMRNRQHLAAIRPLDGALALSTMHFGDESSPDPRSASCPAGGSRPDPKERKLAAQIIDSLTAKWDPERYHDSFTEEVHELVAQRAKGKQVVVEESPAARAQVGDLMQALQASLDAAKKARSGGVGREVERIADRLVADRQEDETQTTPRKAAGASGRTARKTTRARKSA